jgi:hypothetical protein
MLLSSLRILAGAAAAAGALAVTLPAAVSVAQPGGESCFRLSHLDNSRMADDNHVMYMRVYGNQYYRMDFANSCNSSGNEPLILHPVDNSDLICHAIDVNVSVRSTHEGCIPTGLRRLTPDEVAAIPPVDRP